VTEDDYAAQAEAGLSGAAAGARAREAIERAREAGMTDEQIADAMFFLAAAGFE
jgi:alkylhydroperoxidase family enzyme